MPGPSEWLESIAKILDRLGVRWAVIGALAANHYRRTPRFTADVDALVEPHPDLERVLREAGYDVETTSLAGDAPHLLRLTRGEEEIDLMLPVVEYQDVALDRGTDHVISPEDVVIHKLIAWRGRDRSDIREILESGIPLDEDYIAHWVREWEVADRWEEARGWQ